MWVMLRSDLFMMRQFKGVRFLFYRSADRRLKVGSGIGSVVGPDVGGLSSVMEKRIGGLPGLS